MAEGRAIGHVPLDHGRAVKLGLSRCTLRITHDGRRRVAPAHGLADHGFPNIAGRSHDDDALACARFPGYEGTLPHVNTPRG